MNSLGNFFRLLSTFQKIILIVSFLILLLLALIFPSFNSYIKESNIEKFKNECIQKGGSFVNKGSSNEKFCNFNTKD